MKRVTLISAALGLFLPGILHAQSERERLIDSLLHPEISEAGAAMSFERTVIDAGEMPEDTVPPEYMFRWENTGKEPVTVLKISTTCSCAVPSFEKKAVMPGEKSSLKITYHPKGHPGNFDRKIFLYTDKSGSKPAAVLGLKGKVIPKLKPLWAFSYQMGELYLKRKTVKFDAGSKGEERILCLNAGGSPVSWGVETNLLPPYMKVRFEPEVIPAGGYGDIVISYDPEGAPVRLLKNIPVILTGINVPPSQRTVTVIVEED